MILDLNMETKSESRVSATPPEAIEHRIEEHQKVLQPQGDAEFTEGRKPTRPLQQVHRSEEAGETIKSNGSQVIASSDDPRIPKNETESESCSAVGRYLKEVGRIPLLTPEEEVSIFMQIEKAELNIVRHLHRFGCTAEAYLGIAERLSEENVGLGKVITDSELESREDYLRELPLLCSQVQERVQVCNVAYQHAVNVKNDQEAARAFADFEAKRETLARLYPAFRFRAHIIASMVAPIERYKQAIEKAGLPHSVQLGLWLSPAAFQNEYAALKRWKEEAAMAKQKTAESYLRLVVSIAKQFAGLGQPLLDLIQEGNLGLLKAVERFEYRRGIKFATYANWWIRHSIVRSLSWQMRTIRIPHHLLDMVSRLLRVQRQLTQEHGREPTSEEIADELHLPVDRVEALLKMAQHPISLQSPVGEDGEATFGELVADENAEDPLEATGLSQLKCSVSELLNTLKKTERHVLEQRFGLLDGRQKSLQEIGDELNLTRERIRQIEIKALKRMRHPTRRNSLDRSV